MAMARNLYMVNTSTTLHVSKYNEKIFCLPTHFSRIFNHN